MSFINANKKFREGEYKEALALYIELEKKYGKELLSVNIESCKKKIIEKYNQSSSEIISRKNLGSDNEFDNITRVLLDNVSGSIDISKRKELINKINEDKKFESEAAFVKNVNTVPSEWPSDLQLCPLPESTNDYEWSLNYKRVSKGLVENVDEVGLSVIVPTFNRSEILNITLISLLNQKTQYPFEVVVADDGSSEEITKITKKFEDQLDIKFVRQKDYGYQLCAVRNLGIRAAKYEFLAILDCDMAANPLWVESYVQALLKDSDTAYIGPRKYIDTRQLKTKSVYQDAYIFEKLPPVKSDSISTSSEGGISKDWRLAHFEKTDNLRLCNSPFRYFSGGNVAFARKWLDAAGYFDEEFTHWGGEDNEFGYRLYKMGCFFRSLESALAYHQEPPGKENETDRSEGQAITRKIIEQKVPYFYRKLEPIETATIKRVPLVSIYIPAYNCQDSIVRCIESALNQTIPDLEVCVCNDGSTDSTLDILKARYSNHPRVRFVTQENGGIAKASNTAVKMCRGYYIGQLDSDDYLEVDAVELCLNEFFKDRDLACVYTTNRNVDSHGNLISNGYNWPVFSREKFSTAMIVHHFRMFTIRAWNLTSGFDEDIENAVDYDMYLKLSEIGKFKHVNRICYNRVLHGENTSIKKLGVQKKNHFIVVNNALKRQGINTYNYSSVEDNDTSRKFSFVKNNNIEEVLPTLAFSIIYLDHIDNLLPQVNNILKYNPTTIAIVIHVKEEYLTKEILRQVDIIASSNGVDIVLNSDIPYNERSKFNKHQYYLSNFKILEKLVEKPDYLILEAYDSCFVKQGAASLIRSYDIGINRGKINGYWKEKVVSHKTLLDIIEDYFPKQDINKLEIKGTVQGAFYKFDFAKNIFELINIFDTRCKASNDLAHYLTEEIWFPLAASIIECQGTKKFRKLTTLTYMPWDRNLKWTPRQIHEARLGIGIPENKFAISSIN
ncbi:glycosyltransferase [Psychrobacter aquimaris]|uniref:glycosyltransferase n=1 Tax=Psychrobacter aquimaris TaxID=292733 RepID=UPI003FD6B8F0